MQTTPLFYRLVFGLLICGFIHSGYGQDLPSGSALAQMEPADSLRAEAQTPIPPDPDTSAVSETGDAYLPLKYFTYANMRRYTVDGSLPRARTELQPVTASVVGALYVSSVIGLHINQSNAWWRDKSETFNIVEDWESARQVDKAGHFYGGYLVSYISGEAFLASGLSWEASAWGGFLMGVGYQTYIEVEDGFANGWGFSPSDWTADALGATFYLAQFYVPYLQNFTPKWQYVPSSWQDNPQTIHQRTFIDDYNSSTFWLSIDVHNMMPDSWKEYWVPWLNIAVGYGVDAIDVDTTVLAGYADRLSTRRHVIGLDVNLVRLLPDGGWFWNWLRQGLNYLKLPMPSIEFGGRGTKFHLFYPFRLTIGGVRF